MTNRVIKFRAWDIENKGMATWENLLENCDRLSVLALPTYEIMHSTGLIDDGGTEIYSGDIIKIGHHDDEKHEWITTTIDSYGDCEWPYMGADEQSERGPLRYIWYDIHCEIIGNIHENPELLS